MRINDILSAVCLKIMNKFPAYKVYSEKQKQGLTMPCFFVYIVPLVHSNETKARTYKRISIKIVFMTESELNKEYTNMHDELNDLFRLYLSVKDRLFNVFNTTSQIVDGTLSFSFDIEFYELLDDESYDLMKNLDLIINKEA